MRKNGVILNINRTGGLVMLIGTVLSVTKKDDRRCTIRIQHEVDGEWKRTDVTFWNDLDAEEDWRRHTADRVLNMKPRKGSVVMMRCKFQNETMQNATGYSMYYNGLVKIKPDGEHDEENRNVVFGTVSSLKDVTVCGSDAVRANVYVGKRNVNGVPSFHYVTVTLMNDLAIMARTDLAPVANEDDTITRKKAAFCCGKIAVYYHSVPCPICGEPMAYDQTDSCMCCADCGITQEPEPGKKQESAFATDYIVTGEITTLRA